METRKHVRNDLQANGKGKYKNLSARKIATSFPEVSNSYRPEFKPEDQIS